MGDDTDGENGLAGWRIYRAGVKPLRPKIAKKALVKPPVSPATEACTPATQPAVGTAKKFWRRLTEVKPSTNQVGTSRRQATESTLTIDDPQWRHRLRKGNVQPEARLDLHHHVAAAAHQAVVTFITQARQDDRRILLIITGMGEVLRPALPRWLAEPPLKSSIRWVFPAAPAHGGQGAYYVVLRRQRSNSK